MCLIEALDALLITAMNKSQLPCLGKKIVGYDSDYLRMIHKEQ